MQKCSREPRSLQGWQTPRTTWGQIVRGARGRTVHQSVHNRSSSSLPKKMVPGLKSYHHAGHSSPLWEKNIPLHWTTIKCARCAIGSSCGVAPSLVFFTLVFRIIGHSTLGCYIMTAMHHSDGTGYSSSKCWCSKRSVSDQNSINYAHTSTVRNVDDTQKPWWYRLNCAWPWYSTPRELN